MQILETTREGLKRELKVTVPKEDMTTRLSERLDQIKGQVRINGFRQGKVPVAHLRKVYGRQAMAEIVNDLINKETGQILVGRGERAAQRPEIAMTEDEKEAQAILAGSRDFEFTVAYEVLPEIEAPDLATVEIERPVATVQRRRCRGAGTASRRKHEAIRGESRCGRRQGSRDHGLFGLDRRRPV